MRLTPTLTGTAVSALALVGSLVGLPATTATADEADERATTRHPKRSVMVVGNNWAGTASVVDVRTKKKLATIDIVPDLDAELMEIATTPDRLALYLAVQQVVGEGNDQYVDDMYTTPNGKYLAVSRPSLADVVWIDLRKAADGDPDSIVAEQQMDGYRTDHMGVSPDRRRLIVSDSTERQVIEFSMVNETLEDGTEIEMGQRLRTFESGDTPHENNYSKNGRRIFHASIGRVYTPGDYGYVGPVNADTIHDSVKADRWLEIVRNRDFDVRKRWDMGLELEEAGYPGMSSAVRPAALTPDERTMFLQVSFFHGIVQFDLDAPDPTGGGDYTLGTEPEPAVGKVKRIIPLPVSDEVANMPREQYVLDSAHHGLAMNDNGRKLCVAGTMSDYGAIIDRDTWSPKIFKGKGRYLTNRTYSKPYWAVTGPGNTCWMSMSGSDLVTVISYKTERVLAEVPVGDHPQRVRPGRIREAIVNRF
jgi:YVTN family beta-propeller protein